MEGNALPAVTHQFFAAEIERLAGRLYGTAMRLTRDPGEAEDLVAEAVAKAWEKRAELREPQRFGAWIQRILSTTFVSRWRHRRASPEVAAEFEEQEGEDGESFSLYEKLHQPFLLWWSSPEEGLMTKLLREDIERALDALPESFRIAIVLVDVQGHAYSEAAALLGVPVGTVRSRLSRARSLLQRSLWRHAVDAGLVHHNENRKDVRDSSAIDV